MCHYFSRLLPQLFDLFGGCFMTAAILKAVTISKLLTPGRFPWHPWARWHHPCGSKVSKGGSNSYLPSGNLTVCYWKWPFIVVNKDSYWKWPSRNSWFTHEKWWFSIVMLVYQRVWPVQDSRKPPFFGRVNFATAHCQFSDRQIPLWCVASADGSQTKCTLNLWSRCLFHFDWLKDTLRYIPFLLDEMMGSNHLPSGNDDYPINTSIYRGFPIAMFAWRRVPKNEKMMRIQTLQVTSDW